MNHPFSPPRTLYFYCDNDPIQQTDPSGMDGVSVNDDHVSWTFSDGDSIDLGNAVGGELHWDGGKVSIEELTSAAAEQDTGGWEHNAKHGVMNLTLRRLKKELDVDDHWIMAIHTDVAEGEEGDTGLVAGHSWITLHNEQSGESSAYSLYADTHVTREQAAKPGGVQINLDNMIGTFYHAQRISKSEKARFDEIIASQGPQNKGGGARSWAVTDTCASFSSEVFQSTTGVDIDADEWLGFETPREVGQNIRAANGGSAWPSGVIIPPRVYTPRKAGGDGAMAVALPAGERACSSGCSATAP